jgi:CRISPR/Cas system-associated endonuclease Cas1
MNKFILTVQGCLLHPENYTKDQLKENYRAADAVYRAKVSAADAAEYAAARAAYYTARVEYCLNEYFQLTGENRQDYIDAINKGNK